MEEQKERRKFPRLDLAVKIKFKILTDTEQKMFFKFNDYVSEAHSRNISVEGISITTQHMLPHDTIVGLEIFFPELPHPIMCLGKVIWSKEADTPGEFYSGIEFIAIKDKYFDQMSHLIADYFIRKYKISDETDIKGLKKIFLQFFKRAKK